MNYIKSIVNEIPIFPVEDKINKLTFIKNKLLKILKDNDKYDTLFDSKIDKLQNKRESNKNLKLEKYRKKYPSNIKKEKNRTC